MSNLLELLRNKHGFLPRSEIRFFRDLVHYVSHNLRNCVSLRKRQREKKTTLKETRLEQYLGQRKQLGTDSDDVPLGHTQVFRILKFPAQYRIRCRVSKYSNRVSLGPREQAPSLAFCNMQDVRLCRVERCSVSFVDDRKRCRLSFDVGVQELHAELPDCTNELLLRVSLHTDGTAVCGRQSHQLLRLRTSQRLIAAEDVHSRPPQNQL